jgi:ubiquinol-cytochrome c reductase cytochrome b subunit
VRWIDYRLPVFSAARHSLIEYRTPRNLNAFWNFGSLAGFFLVVQIITGVVLAMHYTPHVDHAFDSVQHIMRDVNYGWLIRSIHANGASFFFICVYIHIFRGLYYGSYKEPRELLWWLGIIILIVMMMSAFLGYVLPWGQMSFWGATVITNLFSAIPGIGPAIVEWLWGGFSVDNPTLNRFFSLHYLLPFVIVALVFLHIVALHRHGSNNPLGVNPGAPRDTIPFHPYYTVKDLVGLGMALVFFAGVVFYAPDSLGHPDNYIPADPLRTPPHIVPEWYFLPFYAILRAFTGEVWVVQLASFVTGGIIDAKFFGVIAMFGSIAVMALAPWLDTSSVRSGRYRPMLKWWFWLLVIDFFVLMWLGAQPAEEPYATFALIASAYWFFYFLIILPLLGVIEEPLPRPDTIEKDFDDHYPPDGGASTKSVAAE